MYQKFRTQNKHERIPESPGIDANRTNNIGMGRLKATKPVKEEQKSAKHGVTKKEDVIKSSTVTLPNDTPLESSGCSDTMTVKVKDAWKIIEDQRVKELKRREKTGDEKVQKRMSGWKTVRVFVSSTFTDMHSEREILVKKVFPELREWCEERKFTLVECDLRWGVPKDSSSRTTICTCLEELDRCHEDNDEFPFFVSMLSERYGWIPSNLDVPEDVHIKYDWVPDVSITHMEILHGAYRFDNPNAIFCFRNPLFVKDIPSDKLSRFVDKEELNKLQLKMLKQRLAERFPEQIFEYGCHVDGIDVSTGREKVNIVDLEKFADRILQFLKDAINQQYHDHHLLPEISAEEKENNAHLAAAQIKSEFFVGREKELQSLLTYAKEGRSDSVLRLKIVEEDDEKSEEERAEGRKKEEENFLRECEEFGVNVDDSRIVGIIGESGVGKSSLLARVAKAVMQDGFNVLYHCVGVTDLSTTQDGIMRRIIGSIVKKPDPAGEENKDETEDSEENLTGDFLNALNMAAADNTQLLIIIDGIDETLENQSGQFLSWLPPRFPGNIRCFVSSDVKHYPCIARLESRDSYFLDVDLLTPDGAASMAEYYLQRFNKKLDKDQLSSLTEHKSACLPLWMATACEEMRVFGDFATISEKIRKFPDELNDLLKDVLNRLIREDETSAMKKVLSWICCSSSGLYEKNLLNLLGNPATNEIAPLVTWSTVRRHIKPFIRLTGESRSVRIQMAHKSMNQAAVELLLSNESYLIECHTYLADFYEHYCTTKWMTINELPHHLYNAQLFARMINYFRNDYRSVESNGFNRSKYLSKLRCQNFSMSRGNESLVVICQMCSIRSKLLAPTSFPTKDLCAICGSFAPFKQPNDAAQLCMKHQISRIPMHPPCAICKNMIHSNPTTLYVCVYCHSGGNKCCHVQTD